MPKITTIHLLDHVDDESLFEIATRSGSPLQRAPRFVDGPAEASAEEPELELFMDWDDDRGHGWGGYTQDDDECRSRRIDLRGPTDEDPGPLPMEEAPSDITGEHLILG